MKNGNIIAERSTSSNKAASFSVFEHHRHLKILFVVFT